MEDQKISRAGFFVSLVADANRATSFDTKLDASSCAGLLCANFDIALKVVESGVVGGAYHIVGYSPQPPHAPLGYVADPAQ